MYTLEPWKRLARRAAACVLTFAAAFLAVRLLHDRLGGTSPPVDTNGESTAAESKPLWWDTETETAADGEETEETGERTDEDETYPFPETGETAASSTSVLHILDTALLSKRTVAMPQAAQLANSGMTLQTDGLWDGETMRLGRMQFGYSLPRTFSLRDRQVEKVRYVYPENSTEYTAVTETVTEARPVFSLYMGYILYDNGEALHLIGADGVTRFAFDDTVIRPAYCRDKNGNPLFVQKGWRDGGAVNLYYTVPAASGGFVYSDYDEVRDSRGLRFDYTASWGVTDGDIVRVAENDDEAAVRQEAESREAESVAESARLEAESREKARADALAAGESVPEETAPADTTPKFTETPYDGPRVRYERYGQVLASGYRAGYAYREGMAAVVDDETRVHLSFLDVYGNVALGGIHSRYLANYERYVLESYRLPASDGAEAIGSYYFDHGLVRVRRQQIDDYIFTAFGNIRVISDEDILIDRMGREFPLPAGYTLRGYSDGMILLEKDGRYGFMDYTGTWIAQPVYRSARPFSQGLGVLETEDGRFGMIDREGNIVLPFAYTYLSAPSSGLIAAYTASGWSIFKIMGA